MYKLEGLGGDHDDWWAFQSEGGGGGGRNIDLWALKPEGWVGGGMGSQSELGWGGGWGTMNGGCMSLRGGGGSVLRGWSGTMNGGCISFRGGGGGGSVLRGHNKLRVYKPKMGGGEKGGGGLLTSAWFPVMLQHYDTW